MCLPTEDNWSGHLWWPWNSRRKEGRSTQGSRLRASKAFWQDRHLFNGKQRRHERALMAFQTYIEIPAPKKLPQNLEVLQPLHVQIWSVLVIGHLRLEHPLDGACLQSHRLNINNVIALTVQPYCAVLSLHFDLGTRPRGLLGFVGHAQLVFLGRDALIRESNGQALQAGLQIGAGAFIQ